MVDGQLEQIRRPSRFHRNADMLDSLSDLGQEKEVVDYSQNRRLLTPVSRIGRSDDRNIG
jgi:hypothetical protein